MNLVLWRDAPHSRLANRDGRKPGSWIQDREFLATWSWHLPVTDCHFVPIMLVFFAPSRRQTLNEEITWNLPRFQVGIFKIISLILETVSFLSTAQHTPVGPTLRIVSINWLVEDCVWCCNLWQRMTKLHKCTLPDRLHAAVYFSPFLTARICLGLWL